MSALVKKITTLCVIHNDTHVLLGFKKRGFGAGKWNGFGGKVRTGETIEAAARREVREEAGIELVDCRKRGVLMLEVAHEPVLIEMHVFSSREFRGEPSESEEMKPEWYRLTDIPFGRMWADDKYWLPKLIAGRNFEGRFYFLDHDTLLDHRLIEIPSFEEDLSPAA